MKRQEATLDVDIPRYNQRRAGQQRVGQRQRVHLRVAAGFGCERIDEHPADAQGAYRNVRRGQIGQSVSGVQVGITRMTKVVLLLRPLRHRCATGFWLSSWRVRTTAPTPATGSPPPPAMSSWEGRPAWCVTS